MGKPKSRERQKGSGKTEGVRKDRRGKTEGVRELWIYREWMRCYCSVDVTSSQDRIPRSDLSCDLSREWWAADFFGKAEGVREMNQRANQSHWPCQPMKMMKFDELLGFTTNCFEIPPRPDTSYPLFSSSLGFCFWFLLHAFKYGLLSEHGNNAPPLTAVSVNLKNSSIACSAKEPSWIR